MDGCVRPLALSLPSDVSPQPHPDPSCSRFPQHTYIVLPSTSPQRLLLLFLAILVFSSSSESAPADGVSVNGLARDDRFPWALVSKRSSLPPLAPPTVHLDLRPRPHLAPSPQASSSSVAAST